MPERELERAIAGNPEATTTVGSEGQTTRTMSGPAAPLTYGAKWGRFRLLGKVGAGGFGSVYKAWDPDLEREVAIKILHRSIAGSQSKELLREGRALAKVRHPNVVNVLGLESHEDQVALCMEFVEGETLERVLKTQGTLGAGEAALVGADVCRALAAVHGAGFVHRDVKARNVMREQDGRVVLMDFGAGREARRLMAAEFADRTGTPAYMAPELLAGQPATAASDVYSVGVLLYHLVTAEYPVDGRTMDEIHAAHEQGSRRQLSERRPELPSPFVHVVDRALTADTTRRYPSAGALLEALVALGGRSRTTRVLMRAIPVALGVFALVGLFGFLTTAAFNLSVGRSAAFSDEPPTVWLELGLRSLVTPMLYVAAMALVAWAARFVLRIMRLMRPIGNVLIAAEARLARLAANLNLDDPKVFAQAVAAFGVVALAVIVWQFSDLLRAFATTISDAPAETLRPLESGPSRVAPSLYRFTLDVLVLSFVAALVRIRRLRARRRATTRGGMLPIVAMLALTALLLEMPYRLGWHNEAERLDVGGERCYMLGQTTDEALIYCPDREPPRNQIIQLQDRLVQRSGTFESIFTPPDTPR